MCRAYVVKLSNQQFSWYSMCLVTTGIVWVSVKSNGLNEPINL